jgi:cytidine deaminase
VSADLLIAAAVEARTRAVAPFSNFRVGAAIAAEDGTVIAGCNVESASFGLTVCAERIALFRGLFDGHRRFRRIAVVTDTPAPTPPCGACRQLLWEFAPDAEVILANLSGTVIRYTVRELIPHAFDARQLGQAPPKGCE